MATYLKALMAAKSIEELDAVVREFTDDMNLDLCEFMLLSSLATDKYRDMK